MTHPIAARLTLIVDADTEEVALAIAQRLIARTKLDSVYLGCTPYPKLGAHSLPELVRIAAELP